MNPVANTTSETKRMSLHDAVERFVPDGASIVLGTFMDQKTPFSAAHEFIRQDRSELELIGSVSDVVFDQLVGAGVVGRCRTAWGIRAVSGSDHCLQRGLRQGSPRPIDIIHYSHLTLSLALTAGALGVPYMPTRSVIASSVADANAGMRCYTPPFGQGPLVAVEALRPDVAIIPVQRCDVHGNSHTWGVHGFSIEAAHAARRVILLAEEIVDESIVRADPNRNLFPGLNVAAVIEEPWACHPSPVQGFYLRDAAFAEDYEQASRTAEGFTDWADRWILGVASRREYVERLGEERLDALRVRQHAFAPAVDYGF